MQTVKILGISGSRKLRTYRSKNRVCLLCGGDLEKFIQSEYLDSIPPTPGGAFGKICISEAWKTIASVKVVVAGAWKDATSLKISISESWKNPI